MRVRIQMFLTILIVPLTFRAESELQFRTIYLRPAADRTLMLGDTGVTLYISLEFLPPVDLLRIQVYHIA